MALTMEYTGTLTIVTCPNENCTTTYAIPERLFTERKRDHRTIYCPFGHTWHYPGESDLEREKRLRLSAEARAARNEDALGMERRSLIAYKGHLTRARNKIAAGICPVPDCKQHFANVREHMKFKHPDYHLTDPTTGERAEL